MIRLKESGLSGPRTVMRGRWRRACGGLVVAGFFAVPADAQELPDLQRELREMRQHYDSELKRLRRDYETRIERLEKQVKAAETSFAAHKASSAAATAAAPTPAPGPQPCRACDECRSRATIRADLAAARRSHTEGLPALASAFNPSIGVVLNGHLEAFSQNPNDYFIRGFALGDETSPALAAPRSTSPRSTSRRVSTRICSAI
jgi:hypothetical protein